MQEVGMAGMYEEKQRNQKRAFAYHFTLRKLLLNVTSSSDVFFCYRSFALFFPPFVSVAVFPSRKYCSNGSQWDITQSLLTTTPFRTEL